jgi:hypothetical protein
LVTVHYSGAFKDVFMTVLGIGLDEVARASVVPPTVVLVGNFFVTENRSMRDIVATARILSLFIFLIRARDFSWLTRHPLTAFGNVLIR